MSTKTDDLYAHLTERIIALLEVADENGWQRPWTSSGATHLPVNVATNAAYKGANTIALWLEALDKSYESNVWGTYLQWKSKKAQVRKGERGTQVIKSANYQKKTEPGEDPQFGRFLKTYVVFNAAQIDGYELPTREERSITEIEQAARDFFAALDARVQHGGDRAFYSPSTDYIHLPFPEQFVNEVAYLAVRGHETTHWTGHSSRCNRDFSGRFGNEQYAFEELIAELGAAFLCAELGLTNEPRIDHAHYIKNWVAVLKSDPKAIRIAATAAQKAVAFLHNETTDGVTPADVQPDLELAEASV